MVIALVSRVLLEVWVRVNRRLWNRINPPVRAGERRQPPRGASLYSGPRQARPEGRLRLHHEAPGIAADGVIPVGRPRFARVDLVLPDREAEPDRIRAPELRDGVGEIVAELRVRR